MTVPTVAATRARRLPMALLREARPKQWMKNVLVFAAPGAAGVLTQQRVLARTLVMLAAFCLAASGTYFLNDAADIEADRLHPKKRFRPIASGLVPLRLGVGVGAALVTAGLAVAALLGWGDVAVIGLYLVLTVSYSLRLKHVPVIDLACVAAGFVIRAVAGGIAAEVKISQWFLIVAGAGSLFMVAGKRHGDFFHLEGEELASRPALAGYTLAYIRYVWMLASAVAVSAYALWAFEEGAAHRDPGWYQLSTVPFVLALLRYALMIEQGHGGAPEDVVLSDRTLLVLGVSWVAVFGLGVTLGR
jgi:decaprenyl-phosphate phosphoribosyltransferase